jgi:2'-5' RNA ligase
MDAKRYYAAQVALFDRLVAGQTGSTVVPLRAEYVGVAMCLTLIHLLPNALSALIEDKVIGELGPFRSKHHWYPRSDRHLTLKNVRRARVHAAFPSDLVERASNAIGRVCRAASPLEFDILGPVCLPTSIVVRAIGTPAHRELMLSFDRELMVAGVPDDKAYASNDVFVGNITVCRFTEPPAEDLIEAIAALRDQFIAKHTVRTACLVQCDEVCSSGSLVLLREFALEA